MRMYIKSIPRVESHYARADTNKEYVCQWGLSVTALYRKYVELCETKRKMPGKLSSLVTFATQNSISHSIFRRRTGVTNAKRVNKTAAQKRKKKQNMKHT